MTEKHWLQLGAIGVVIAALCCFTPILVVLLSGLGLAAWTGHLDMFLLPALAIFTAILIYALWRRQRAQDCCATDETEPNHD